MKAEKGRGKLVRDMEAVYALIDSFIVCKFSRGVYYKAWEDLAQYYTLVTGIEMTPEALAKVGERLNNLGRLFNIREGLTRKDDTLPKRFVLEPLPSGGSKGKVVPIEEMIDDYYEARGWEKDTGIPSREKLYELGLVDVAADLERYR